ncbi:MAG: hypothetical protein JSR30_07350, partial [Proteobacteria bacterium]|nr:hypothetical protein [Pseudomonadota bacterium]
AWTHALTPQLGAHDLMLALPNGLTLPDALAKPAPDRPTAWICSGTACQPPVVDLDSVLE